MKHYRIIMSIFLLIPLLISAQFVRDYEGRSGFARDYTTSSERYITTRDGDVVMFVNVWGQVQNPGHHMVYEGIDLATLLSFVGGPAKGANLKKVRLYREIPDENGQLVYEINMEKFLKTGNRSDFVKILPNDTYIIPQTISSYVLQQAGTVNTIFSLVNVYVMMMYYYERTK